MVEHIRTLDETERDEFADEITDVLENWNFTDEDIDTWFDDFSRDRNRTLVVVEDWYSRKELNGVRVLWAELEHQTDDAFLFKHASDFTERHERSGHFQTHFSEVWIPKSVVEVAVSMSV